MTIAGGAFTVIQEGPVLFADDFETGDTSAWSVTLPERGQTN